MIVLNCGILNLKKINIQLCIGDQQTTSIDKGSWKLGIGTAIAARLGQSGTDLGYMLIRQDLVG